MNPYQSHPPNNRRPQNNYNQHQQQYQGLSNNHPYHNMPNNSSLGPKNINQGIVYQGQGQPSPSFSNSSQKNYQSGHQAGHQQFFDQYSNSNNSPNFRYEQQNFNFPPPQGQQGQPPKNKLIQPPQLLHQDVRQSNSNSQGNTFPKSSGFQNEQADQNDMRDVVWNKQENVNQVFWQQKFFLIYQKFEWFAQRFQMIRAQYFAIKEQLTSVDSEDDWNQLKQHHDQFAQKLQQMFQELVAVAGQNQQLIQQKANEGGGDGVWQQRYHELLSNFKALQDQNIQIQQELQHQKSQGNASNGGIQQERYNELSQHYNRLQEQYDKVVAEYQILRDQYQKVAQNGGGNGPSMQDFQNAQQQFQMKMQTLHGQNEQLQNACQQLYEQKQHLKQQLINNGQMQEQYEQLIHAIQQKQAQNAHIQNQFSKFKSASQSIHKDAQQQLQNRQKQKQDLKRTLNQKNKQLKEFEYKIEQVQSEAQFRLSGGDSAKLRNQNQVLKKQKAQSDQSFSLLKQQMQRLYSKTNQKDLSQMKVKSLQQKITYLTQQNHNLNQKLKQKSNEIIQMRSISYQIERLKNITNDYSELQRQKNKLQQAMRKDKSQINALRKNIDELNIIVTELNAKKFQNKSRGYQTQIQTLNDSIQKKQSQANKFKQLVTVKDNYIQDLQLEVAKLKGKISNMENLFDNERDQFKKRISQLQRNNQAAEKKNRGLQLQFGQQLKKSLEQQIQELRKQNQVKLQKNRHIQDQNDQLKAKLMAFEKNSISFNKNNQHTFIRIQQLQASKEDILSKLSHIQREVKAKEDDLRLSRDREIHTSTILKSTVEQLQHSKTLWQSKNNVIKQLEKQVNDFMNRITDIQRQTQTNKENHKNQLTKANQEINNLRNKLTEIKQGGYQSRISHQSAFSKSSPAKRNRQELGALQGKIIDQLTEQNAKLKNDILELNNQVQQIKNQKPQSRLKSQKSQKSIKQVGSNIIEERLLEFNDRLQSFITDNKKIAGQGIQNYTYQQRVNLFEKEKRQLEIVHEKQIRLLKEQIAGLRKNTDRSKHSRIKSDEIYQTGNFKILSQENQRVLGEQVDFYKQKLSQQTKTNQKIIKTNQELKNQLQEYLNSKRNQYSTSQYYKMQWRESSAQIQSLNIKVKKLQQQNRRFKNENIQHDTRIAKDYEQKIFQLQMKIQELNRKISILELTKTKADDQRANLVHDIGIYDSQNRSLQKTMSLRVAQSQKQAKELKQRCEQYQKQMIQLIQRLKKHEVEANHSSLNQNQNLTRHNQAIKI